MVYPTLDIEKKLWDQGYSRIAGVDEVGRGAWAGPVVAAAVILPQNVKIPEGLRDSKLLTPQTREKLDKRIKEIATSFAVGQTSVEVIEKRGIAVATQMAMRQALRLLEPEPDFSLIDFYTLKYVRKSYQKAIKKGDLHCASIAAASILAKVFRDHLMRELDNQQEFRLYQFGKHKGYGTKLHQEIIQKHGCCRIHRLSFIPNSANGD